MTCKYQFSFIPEYFVDYADIGKHSPQSLVTTQPQLGLLQRSYDSDVPQTENLSQWSRFAKHVESLNRNSLPNESYKVLYVIRHGSGVHNIAMRKVGSEAWKDHWSHLEGDGEFKWLDAKLVQDGILQAQKLSELWLQWSNIEHMPLPETLYTSPLARCLETTRIVFSEVLAENGRELRPIIKELLRERCTDHTCDKRSTRSWIQENYPAYLIEDGFAETDMLWQADSSESSEQHTARKQALLEDIFEHDDSAFISLTTHSYALSAILEAIGAPKFRVAEGVMVALFVKVVKI